MIVLVDMDGPLADFDKEFYLTCAAGGYLMHGGAVNIDNRCDQHRFATDCIDLRAHREAARAIVDHTRWFMDLEPTAGAQEGLERLSEQAEVFVCSKPLEANRWCRDDKAAWLKKHFGKHWVSRLILAPDKSMVRGDILLDDAPKARWLSRAEWRPVIFPTAWNGVGSKFSSKTGLDDFQRWSWGDGIDRLLL